MNDILTIEEIVANKAKEFSMAEWEELEKWMDDIDGAMSYLETAHHGIKRDTYYGENFKKRLLNELEFLSKLLKKL